MSWTLSTSGAAIVKAGVGANSDILISGAVLAEWSDEAEQYACGICRTDVITNYSSLTANGKKVLGMLATAQIAQNIVNYDTSGYSGAREAETILDVLETQVTRAEKILRDDKNRKYLGI